MKPHLQNLKVRKRMEFMHALLDIIPEGAKISFEGDFRKIQIPDIAFSEKEESNLIRNTTTPKQNFWIFKIDSTTRNYLKNNLVKRNGISTNVEHILIENNNSLDFASYDNFHNDCVVVNTIGFIDEYFIKELGDGKIISS